MKRCMWLAILTCSAVGGWFCGKTMQGAYSQRALLFPDASSEKVATRNIEAVFPAGSPRGLWMERVKKAGIAEFPILNTEWESVFPYEEQYEEGYPPNALNALRWMLGI